MSNFKKAMRRMRQYTTAVKKNYESREKELSKIEELKGCDLYRKKTAEIDKTIEQKRVELAASVRGDMQVIVNDMRNNINDRIAKAPTTDMVNNLALLEKFDTLTPGRIRIYAGQMAACPLALDMLQQIAAKHDIHIQVPNVEEMARAVDVFEWNLAAYIDGYRGSEENLTFTVKNLNQYFQDDDLYAGTVNGGTDEVDSKFWNEIVGIGNPEMFDTDGSNKDVKVQLYFATVGNLNSYIKKQTEGMEFHGTQYEEKVKEILADCPDTYGAAYRAYLATHEDFRLEQELE